LVAQLAVAGALVVLANRWVLSLIRLTTRFHTISDKQFVLRYAPELALEMHGTVLLATAHQCLSELETFFGPIHPTLLRRRVYIYFLGSCTDVKQLFGSGYAAMAIPHLHAIVLTFTGDRTGETLKHELAHLFSDRWNAAQQRLRYSRKVCQLGSKRPMEDILLTEWLPNSFYRVNAIFVRYCSATSSLPKTVA
jgi:hypothetical protein